MTKAHVDGPTPVVPAIEESGAQPALTMMRYPSDDSTRSIIETKIGGL
jgi:hypothetical protein